MTYHNNSLGRPVQSADGTWVLGSAAQASNGFSVTLPVDRHCAEPFRVGNLVRLSDGQAEAEKVLWRVVTQVPGVFGPLAVLVPTEVPSSVPSASVQRVELAVRGRPQPTGATELAA